MSAWRAAARFSVVVVMPNRVSRSFVRSLCGSLAVIHFASTAWEFSNPPIIAPAIAPPPMNASDLPLNTFVRFAAILAVLFVTFYFLLFWSG